MSSSTNKPRNMIEAAKALAGLPPKEAVQSFMQVVHQPGYGFYDGKALRAVKLLDASEGRADFEFIVTEDMCNAAGTLHGGCAATLLDNLTSLALATVAKPGLMDMGSMSRTLTCTYHRAMRPGEVAKVVCRVMSAGKTMSHVSGEILTADGKVAVSCAHDKVVRQASKL